MAGMFYGIGHQPNTSLIEGQVELDEKGYVKVRLHSYCGMAGGCDQALGTPYTHTHTY